MTRDELDALLLKYLDGCLDLFEAERLKEHFRVHPEDAARLLDLSDEELLLRDALSTRSTRIRRPRRQESTAWIPWAAAGAAAILLLAFAASRPSPAVPKKVSDVRVHVPAPELPDPPPPPAPVPAPPLVPVPVPVPVPAPVPPPPLPPPAKKEPPLPLPDAPPTAPKEPELPKPKTITAVARLDRVQGEVLILTGAETRPAVAGQPILPSEGLRTRGAESSASVRFPDESQVDLGGDSEIPRIASAKAVELREGTLTAQVVRQPAGQSMIFTTPHGEAKVLGTRLILTATPTATRLEVKEGRVRLTRLSDGAFTDVSAGSYAVAAEGTRPAAKKAVAPRVLLSDDFEDALGSDARWQRMDGGFPTTLRTAVEIDLSPRPGDSYAAGGWHAFGGLRSKAAFAVPFRLSVDVELSHRDAAINAIIVFAPKSGGARNDTGAVKNELAVRLRGPQYGLLVEGQRMKEVDVPWTPPLRERWTIEVDRQELRFRAGGKDVARQAHGLTLTEEYRVELTAAAKLEAPAGARVRFDNVRVEP